MFGITEFMAEIAYLDHVSIEDSMEDKKQEREVLMDSMIQIYFFSFLSTNLFLNSRTKYSVKKK